MRLLLEITKTIILILKQTAKKTNQ